MVSLTTGPARAAGLFRPRAVLSALVAVAVLLGAGSAASAQTCRQALLLGLDVSLSVDPHDFALQRDGLADALNDPEVVAMLVPRGRQSVDIAVFEWSGQYDQQVVVPWRTVTDAAVLRDMATILRAPAQPMRTGRTAIGAAMLFARDMMGSRNHCAQLTLDLSGDGKNNNGPGPARARGAMDQAGITVNGLVIQSDPGPDNDLARYYQQKVITGPGSFVEMADDFQGYAQAMQRKLLRELAPAIGLRRPNNGPVRLARH